MKSRDVRVVVSTLNVTEWSGEHSPRKLDAFCSTLSLSYEGYS
jgi:hypothetical protein